MNPALLTSILDRLESLEDPLLSWGVVDGGFSTDELRQVIGDELTAGHEWDLSADDVIEEMTTQALLVHDSSWRLAVGAPAMAKPSALWHGFDRTSRAKLGNPEPA